MPIRRRTTTTTRIDEFDDSVDAHSGTNLPAQSVAQVAADVDEGTSIDYYDPENKVAPETASIHSRNITVGRTVSDLVVESKNDKRIMAVVLTVISLIIVIPKIDTKLSVFENLKYGLVIAFVLNAIWFGISVVGILSDRGKKQQNTTVNK